MAKDMPQTWKSILLIALYGATLGTCFYISLADAALVERMILSEAPYATNQNDHDKIVRVASATRMGIENAQTLIYWMALKYSVTGLITVFLIFIMTTVILLFYSDLNGTLWEYSAAFITPIWILSIANIFNTILKIVLCRIFGSLSLGMFFRPFDWNDIWQVLAIKTDIFLMAYIIAVGIGCAAIARIRKSEAIAIVLTVWIILYFTAMILGIEPVISM